MGLTDQPPPLVRREAHFHVKTIIAPGNLAGKRVCLFAAASPECRVKPYVHFHLDALKQCGLTVLLVLSAERIPNASLRRQANNCDGFLVRTGPSTSFEAWSDAFRAVPALWQAEAVLLVDDTAFGPVGDLRPLMQKAFAASADFVGMTESFAGRRHFPSYFLLLKRRALQSPQVRAFWRGGVAPPDRALNSATEKEVDLLQACQVSGLTSVALFPSSPGARHADPSWTELLDQGYPYLPVDAPATDWEDRIEDTALLEAIRLERGEGPVEAGSDAAKPAADGGPSPANRKDDRKRSRQAAYEAIYQGYLAQALNVQKPGEYIKLSEHPVRGDVSDVRLMAYYLPQYHTISENDAWWGRGFTEWSNVSKAVPIFAGHYQPRLPGELGYYDLRVPDVMRRQAELASHYGISAFCIYAYWFGGKRLLESPLLTLLANKDIEIQFSLCWANENWTRSWDGADHLALIAQTHSPGDDLAFIRHYRKYFEDSRYLRIDGKPVLTVYRPGILPDAAATVGRWREEATRMGFPGLYLVATKSFGFTEYQRFGFDALSEFPPHGNRCPEITTNIDFAVQNFAGSLFRYEDAVARTVASLKADANATVWPGVMVAWDNSARRQLSASIFDGSTPQLYRWWLERAIKFARTNPAGQRFVVINAWNEWAEGAYLEPDRRFGYAYLAASAEALEASSQ
jgi:lipopolysaccharide biosynthesis protein